MHLHTSLHATMTNIKSSEIPEEDRAGVPFHADMFDHDGDDAPPDGDEIDVVQEAEDEDDY